MNYIWEKAENLEDTAKILSTYGDGFMLRTDSDDKVDNFKKYLSIPIINGLSPHLTYASSVRCVYS